jgi:peptidyl-prolyl cis-trans isomerase SurA
LTDILTTINPRHTFTSRLLQALMIAAIFASGLMFADSAKAASKIKYIVNGEAITSYDIAQRAAFFKLRRIKGNSTTLATEELIEETIKMQTAKRLKMIVGNKEVEAAFGRFAKGNRMSSSALNNVLNRAGVTGRGFKKYIRAQMSWQRVMAAKLRAESSQNSTQDIFANIHAQGGKKPTSTEYTLQQVIFVVPKAKRARLMAKRRRDARAFRNRFENCSNTIQFAKGLQDVTVRSLGRVLKEQLPSDWKKMILATSEGKATKVRDTPRGVEFLAICKATSVSDDRVAQLNFRSDQAKSDNKSVSALEKKFVKELRDKSVITKR